MLPLRPTAPRLRLVGIQTRHAASTAPPFAHMTGARPAVPPLAKRRPQDVPALVPRIGGDLSAFDGSGAPFTSRQRNRHADGRSRNTGALSGKREWRADHGARPALERLPLRPAATPTARLIRIRTRYAAATAPPFVHMTGPRPAVVTPREAGAGSYALTTNMPPRRPCPPRATGSDLLAVAAA